MSNKLALPLCHAEASTQTCRAACKCFVWQEGTRQEGAPCGAMGMRKQARKVFAYWYD